MTLERRWLVTVVALVGASLALLVALSYGIGLFNAQYGARGWLASSYEGPRARLIEQTFLSLEADGKHAAELSDLRPGLEPGAAELLERSLPPHVRRSWLTSDPRAPRRVRSAIAPCEAAPPDLDAVRGPRAIVWCGRTPVLLARVKVPGAAATLWLGVPLDQAFVDELKHLSLHEAELWGPHGVVATTYQLADGSRVPGAFAAGDRQLLSPPGAARFAQVRLKLGGPYRGYFDQKEPDEWGKRMAGTGSEAVELFAFSQVLEPAVGPADLRVVFGVPADLMMFGPRLASVVMGVIGLLVTVAVALVARRLIRSFSRPLHQLEQAARAAAAGEAPFEIALDRGASELSSLSASFAAMRCRAEESQRRASQSEKMAAVGTLAGGVAHEINNPLGVILGFAQGLERRVPEGDKLRLPVASIVREALRCKALVQELLTFSRVSTKTDEPVDVEAALSSSLLLLGARAKTQNVEIVTRLQPGLPLLRGSRTHLQQVLVNLGTNALDVMKRGGTLTVEAAAGDGKLTLEVGDTGSGIPAELRGRIFEPFFTTKPVGEGTGLGLSLVYQIVQQHHGRIDIASTGPDGTVMRVTLPLPQAAAQAAA